MANPENDCLEQAQGLVARFNTIFMSHKRLPLDARYKFERSEPIVIYLGTKEKWTVRLTLTIDNNRLLHHIDIDESLPTRMHAMLVQKKELFGH